MLRPLLSAGLDALFPPRTLDGDDRTLNHGLSVETWTKITFVDPPLCNGCGAPQSFETGLPCLACQARPRRFERARAACIYDQNSRDLILMLKHADRTDLAPLFASWLMRAAGDLACEADLIAPVPLHWSRLLRRRYNQAAEVGRLFARNAGRRWAPDLLVRRRRTEIQGGKSAAGRRRNVAGAFAVRSAARSQVAGKRILLVDDVLTTGATAEACARALRLAGAQAVDLAAIARVKEASNLTI